MIDFDVRVVESPQVAEIYISASPTAKTPIEEQAKQIFSRIRDILISKNAFIFQERVFATQSIMQSVCDIRSEIYRDIDDGVAPSCLVCKSGLSGPLAAVQVHAVSARCNKEIFHVDQIPYGRILHSPTCRCLGLSNLSAPLLSGRANQIRAIFEKTESLLKQFGGSLA